MRRFLFVVVGLLLIAICVGWFLGPLQDVVMDRINGTPGAPEAGTRSGTLKRSRPARDGGFDIRLLLDAANAVIGLLGLIMAFRAGRGARS